MTRQILQRLLIDLSLKKLRVLEKTEEPSQMFYRFCPLYNSVITVHLESLNSQTILKKKNTVNGITLSDFKHLQSFHGGSDSKECACNAGDHGSIPWSGRSPRERNGCPLQYSCLGNPMDRGAWRATVYGRQSVRHN